jgi:isoquinoline 1-oxidoreductase beta subunit
MSTTTTPPARPTPVTSAASSILNRRNFLQASAAAGAGLIVGFYMPGRGGLLAAAQEGAQAGQAAGAGAAAAPNTFVRIASDNSVTVLAKHVEMGQGAHTGLATILAEELDADWAQVRVESAPADASRYNNLAFGQIQGTGGSTAMANSWEQMRKAGATVRAMLVAAAAAEWKVPAGEIAVAKGVVSHAGSNRRATFGELADKAAAMPPPSPSQITLKDPSKFTLIGTKVTRVDSKAKSTGAAQFTIDVYRPDMLTAVIARPPRFGATVGSFDASAAKAINGVVDVIQVPQGVAVLARSTWPAIQGRKALKIVWNDRTAEARGSAELFAEYRKLASQPGTSARKDGDAAKAIASAPTQLEAVYEFPYLAHAPMEPMDCVVARAGSDSGSGSAGGVGTGASAGAGATAAWEIWAGSQLQTVDQQVAAKVLGVKPEQVVIHTQLAGGSFGRRATASADVVAEATSIAKAIDGRQPVKLIWTREDDITGGLYRPLYVHRLRAALDKDGALLGWHHHIVGQSITSGTFFEPFTVKNGVDATSVEGAHNLPYDIPNLTVELTSPKVAVPVLWWRSVGSTHTAFSTETFLDELAYVAKKDPVEFRRALLKKHPRHLGVLELAAQKAGWNTPLPEGRARGVAVHESFASYVAQVVEVSRGADGRPKVERVVCAVDCGIAINPDVVRAQMEGCIGFGLGAALHNEIVLDKGRARQSNFHDYKPLRIDEMPVIEVHIVPSAQPPTGVGEPGLPPLAPAVANAWFKLTGERVRRLPFLRQEASNA